MKRRCNEEDGTRWEVWNKASEGLVLNVVVLWRPSVRRAEGELLAEGRRGIPMQKLNLLSNCPVLANFMALHMQRPHPTIEPSFDRCARHIE